jgi:uncharacterized protein (DUF305 family)
VGLSAGVGLVLYVLWADSDLLQKNIPELGLIQKPSEVDIGFVQSMSLHHDQAITMAQIAEHKGGPWVKQFAHGIVLKQLSEMGLIAGWLGVWKAPMLPADNTMSWLEKGKNRNAPIDALYLQQCRATPGLMPGMFTMEQMNELRGLEGDAFDQRFLKMMIEHHQGGIPMAKFAVGNAESYLVKSMANSIMREQSIEIGVMTKMMNGLAAQN